MTPQKVGSLLFFSAYYNGALALTLDENKPGYSGALEEQERARSSPRPCT